MDVAGEAEDEEDVGVTGAVTRETIEDASTPREMRVKMDGDGSARSRRPRDDEEETAEEEEEDAMSSSRKMWREFLSLLVAVGGVKGTVAVRARCAAGARLGNSGISSRARRAMNPGAQALLGFALATPTMVYDAVVMGVDWTGRAEGMNEREGTENPSASPTGRTSNRWPSINRKRR